MINLDFIRQVGPLKWVKRYTKLQFNKRVLRRDSHLKLPTGNDIILPINSQSATEVYVTNADMDWGAEQLFSKYADSKRDFLDIGAHIGYYSAYLSPLVRNAYAFEPDPRNIPSLEHNARLCGNVTVVRKPVTARNQNVFLSFDGNSATTHISENRNSSSVELSAISIDEYIKEHPYINVGLIKTDIEGRDFDAIIGAEETIKTFSPLILTESDFCSDLDKFLHNIGYSVFAFVKNKSTQRASLEELKYGSIQGKHTKMIFLVPPHLHNSFSAYVSYQ